MDGLRVRRQGRQWLGTVQVGAATPEEARATADGYLSRKGVAATWTKTTGGERVKVGVMGLRRYSVIYQLSERPQ